MRSTSNCPIVHEVVVDMLGACLGGFGEMLLTCLLHFSNGSVAIFVVDDFSGHWKATWCFFENKSYGASYTGISIIQGGGTSAGDGGLPPVPPSLF